MSMETQNRILELDGIASNANEEVEKIATKSRIIEAHLFNLAKKKEFQRDSNETLTDYHLSGSTEIEELKLQLVSLQNEALILRRKKRDAEIRKKCLLRNQKKICRRKTNIQVEMTKVKKYELETKLESLNMSKECDENFNDSIAELIEDCREQRDRDKCLPLVVDNNNFITVDSKGESPLTRPLQESNLCSSSQADTENNSYAFLAPTPSGDNKVAPDVIEEASHDLPSAISPEDEEFVPTTLPPKEEWRNPLFWRERPSFSKNDFRAIAKSPPIDWSGRYMDASSRSRSHSKDKPMHKDQANRDWMRKYMDASSRSRSHSKDRPMLKDQGMWRGTRYMDASSRSRSHSEDRANPMGVAVPKGMGDGGRQSRSRVKRVQQMKDIANTKMDVKPDQQEDANNSETQESLAKLEGCKYETATKSSDQQMSNVSYNASNPAVGKYQECKPPSLPEKSATSANNRLHKKCVTSSANNRLHKKCDNNNVSAASPSVSTEKSDQTEFSNPADIIQNYLRGFDFVRPSRDRILKGKCTLSLPISTVKGKCTLSLPISTVRMAFGMSVLHDNTIVISDSHRQENSVKMFDPSGKLVRIVNPGHPFVRPSDIVTLRSGNFAVRDDLRIQVFSKEGKYLSNCGSDKIDKCFGLTEDDQGRLVTLNWCNPEGRGKKRGGFTVKGETDLFFIDVKDGQVVQRIELADIIKDKSNSKCRFLRFHKGIVYITDLGLDCVYILDPVTNVVKMLGSTGSGVGQFSDPGGLVCDDEGNLIIADSKNHRLQIFNKDNGGVCPLGLDVPVRRPSGVELHNGQLYVLNLQGPHGMIKYKLS